MKKNRLLKAVARFLELPQEEPYLTELLTPEQTRRALERERARSDRTGAELSVATFNATNPDTERLTLTWLVKVLHSRLRNTDEIGWLSSHEVCAMLIATPPAGAWKVIEEVLAQLPDDVPRPNCVVYTYPNTQPGWHERLAEAVRRPSEPAQQRQTVSLDRLFVRSLPAWKRTLDILGALMGLLVLSPILVLVALAVKFTSPGPVLFRQVRSGRGGRPFVIYKFRTMVVDAEARKAALLAMNERDGPAFKIKCDPRITPIGRLLRCTSLDELPQLWNILVGDMTLVGPRPLPCAEADACAGWQRRRLDVTPGLTCIWQVRGRGGVAFADWMRMDLEYIRKRSLWHDLKLLLWTIPAVLLRRGAH
jgi:lipopolysaccharide/colanic/teichoic acid biosynthesis glycosyltransferase